MGVVEEYGVKIILFGSNCRLLKARNPMFFPHHIHGIFPALLCLSHFPPLALFGIPVHIPVLPRWPFTEAYPRDL